MSDTDSNSPSPAPSGATSAASSPATGAPAQSSAPTRSRSYRRSRRARLFMRQLTRFVFLVIGPVVVLVVGGVWYMNSGRIVSTENAYVKTDHILVTPAVDGIVVEVTARDNESVAEGAPLFRIDPEPFRIELEKASAELEMVEYEVDSWRAAWRQARAELQRAHEEVTFLEREYQRRVELGGGRAVAKMELDRHRHEWQLALKRIPEMEEKVRRTLADLGGDPELAAEDHPRYRHLLAVRERAALDLKRATVRAPVGGHIANLRLEPGEYVIEGTPVFSILAAGEVWVETNLKETQLTHVREGQSAIIRIDAYPDHEWRGEVASVSPGAGSEFSLLPAQNASGNWVKVVQRIPVRVSVQPEPGAPILRVGMSAEVEIDTGHERALPGFMRSALALVGIDRAAAPGG